MEDERQSGEEAAGGRPVEPDEHAASGEIDEERLRAALEELRRLKVEDLAQEMMVTLVTVGYQKLGLTEQTRQLRDLRDARLAIELLRACVDTLSRERGEPGLEALRGTLDAMQLDYARTVTSESGTAHAAPGEAPPDREQPGAADEAPPDREQPGAAGEAPPDREQGEAPEAD